MKKYAISFISLAIFFLLILGCAKSIDRTYGPINLEINSNIEPYMGEEVTFNADLGFQPYKWNIQVNTTLPTGTDWDTNGSTLVVDLGYLENKDSFPITVSVRDKYGNTAEKDYLVKKIPVRITNTLSYYDKVIAPTLYVYNSNDDLYAWVDRDKMVDFDHWEKDTGPITLTNVNSIPVKITNDGSNKTGIAHIWAVNSRGQKSAERTIIVYNTKYLDSDASKDGYLSKNMQSGIVTGTSNDTHALFGYQKFPETVYRAYYSFQIPSDAHVYRAEFHFSVDDVYSKPTDISSDDHAAYVKFIGKDCIPSSGVTQNQWIYLDEVPSDDNGYYRLACNSSSLYLYFNNTKENWGYYYPNLIQRINECRGASFDVGIRFQNEKFSDTTQCSIYTADTSYSNKKPYLFIYYY